MSGIIGGAGSKSGIIGTTELEYEEGTWTPNVGSDATYNAQTGIYQKVGNCVTCQFQININNLNSGSTTKVYGLPFTSANISSVQTGHCSYFENVATSVTFLAFYIENNNTSILFISSTGTASGTCQNAPVVFESGTVIYGAVSYLTP